jgi:hypothetical protein
VNAIDSRLDGLEPADDTSWQTETGLYAPDLCVLAKHHSTPHRVVPLVPDRQRGSGLGLPG